MKNYFEIIPFYFYVKRIIHQLFNKLFLSVLVSLFLSTGLNAQWNTINVNTSQNLYSVDYFSVNDIWIGSFNSFIRTSNNGNTWSVLPVVDPVYGTVIGNMNDIEMISSTAGIATGFFYLGNSEVILHTTNSGSNWNIVTLNNSGIAPRYMNAVDRRGTVAYAVGARGRVAKSLDAGASWSFLSSGITSYLNDVKMISPDTILAVGDNRLLRSFNGGQTWSLLTVPESFNHISHIQNTTYFGAEYSNKLFKSIDGGQTTTSYPLPFSYNGVIYAKSIDTVLIAGRDGLYISVNGGQYCEKFDLPDYQSVNMIDFLNSSAIAVGDSGYAIRISNIANAPTLPLASFTITSGSNYCIGDTIILTNSTPPISGYSYNWKLDNVTFANQYNSSLVINVPGTYVISLTVSNSRRSVTVSQTINVTGHDIQSFSLQSGSATACVGSGTVISVPNSQTGTTYRLRKGFTNVGAVQNGNGNTLYFGTGALSAPTLFNIIAERTNSCFTDSIVLTQLIDTTVGHLKASCVPAGGSNNVGISKFVLGNINNISSSTSGYYTDYTCLINANLYVGQTYPLSLTTDQAGECKIWLDMDTNGIFIDSERLYFSIYPFNGNITIPASLQIFNVPMRLRVAYNSSSFIWGYECGVSSGNGEYEDYSVTIINLPLPPEPSFSYRTTQTCSTALTFINSTFNATGYLWDFGDGTTSISKQPSHTYVASGQYQVKLIATNAYGSDSTIQIVNIQIPTQPTTAFCNPTPYPLSCTKTLLSGGQINSGNTVLYNNFISAVNNAFVYDSTCTKQVKLIRDSTYSIYFYLRDIGTTNCGGWATMWGDWNNDGVFTDSTERIINGNIGGCGIFYPFTIPSYAVLNAPLRLRILASENYISTPCDAICGQYADFSAIIRIAPLSIANFTSDITTGCTPSNVNFTSTSTNAVSYRWDFGDGNSSSLANPSHIYSSSGTYSVKLVVCNSNGECDSVIKSSYINITSKRSTVLVTACSAYTIGSNTYTTSGTYIDTVSSTSGCDSIITTILTILPGPGVTIAASGNIEFCAGDSVQLTATTSGSTFQWYRNSIPISGATSLTYQAKTRGYYYCASFDTAQCWSNSNTIRVKVVCQTPDPINIRSIEPTKEETLSVFPNPTTGTFTIDSPGGILNIYNYTGSLVLTKEVLEGRSEVQLNGNAEGVYYLLLKGSNNSFKGKIIFSGN